MTGLLNVLWTVFWGVLVLSVLVFVHEGGHYLAARAFHVRATEFFLGMPCRFKLSRKSRSVGTEFGVTPILLGGYTRICGMEGATDELLAPALDLVTRRGRVRAQEVADELHVDLERAYELLVTLSDWAAIQPYYDPLLEESPNQKNYPAAFEAPARDANLLTEYDRGHDFALEGSSAAGEGRDPGMGADEFLEHERSRTYLGVGFVKRVVMLVAGPLVNIVLAFLIVTVALMFRGVDYVSNVSTISGVTEGAPAAAAGLQAGDTIVSVAGEPVSTWDDLVAAFEPLLESGTDFELVYERDGAEKTVLVDLPDGVASEQIGVLATVDTYHPDFLQAASATFEYTGQVASYVVKLIIPSHTMEVLDQSSSVVGIAVMTSEAASAGAFDLALVVAAISMSLGFMNLLPIPPFDGGKILIEIIQLVRRKPLSNRAVNALSYLGIAFMLFVFAIVLRNDIARFILG